jgi:hypothetical protein
MSRQKIIGIAAMAGWLVAAYFMDRAVRALQLYSSRTFRTTVPFAIATFFELLFAGMAVFLFWLLLVRINKSSLVGWICLALGLAAFFLGSPFRIYLSARFSNGLLLYQIRDLPFIQRNFQYLVRGIYAFLNSFTILGFFADAGAFTFVLGLANLLRKPKEIITVQG